MLRDPGTPPPEHPTRIHWWALTATCLIALVVLILTMGWSWVWLAIVGIAALAALARFYFMPSHR